VIEHSFLVKLGLASNEGEAGELVASLVKDVTDKKAVETDKRKLPPRSHFLCPKGFRCDVNDRRRLCRHELGSAALIFLSSERTRTNIIPVEKDRRKEQNAFSLSRVLNLPCACCQAHLVRRLLLC
jgi:hypothetical protein